MSRHDVSTAARTVGCLFVVRQPEIQDGAPALVFELAELFAKTGAVAGE